jgi:hypothetical protein
MSNGTLGPCENRGRQRPAIRRSRDRLSRVDLYVTPELCDGCAKLLAAGGIERIIWEDARGCEQNCRDPHP